MGKRVLVTGTNGYLGTSFEQYIKKLNGNMPQDLWHVTFVSMRNENWKEMDFSEYDVILHAAAIVHKKEMPDMEQLYFDVNCKLTKELAEKAKAEKVKQFVFLSTMSVYGIVTGRITADTKPAPTNFYGKSKLAAEEALLELADEQFSVSIVRPPMIYGKECTGNYRLLEKLAVKIPFFPKTKNERSMLYIDNLSEFLRLVMEREAGGVFCPQNAEFVNTSAMVATIRKSYGKKAVTIPGFGWLLNLFAGKISLFAKVFGTLTYGKEMSVYEAVGNYQIVDFEESIHGSKH
ncbi:MAG: NAD-dependent epimerase/dehydratase family protein [Lachnospiraceae bacterium]|nr:NAD-dependent epimerase/dehydratase family protein [Lachnospiraceae bacterium]